MFLCGGRIFTRQLRFTEDSFGGDSGALVIKMVDNKAIGLVIGNAGCMCGAVANPIYEVNEFLEVDLKFKWC